MHYILIRVFFFFFLGGKFLHCGTKEKGIILMQIQKNRKIFKPQNLHTQKQKKKRKKEKTLMGLRMCLECTMPMLFTLKKYKLIFKKTLIQMIFFHRFSTLTHQI
jgi:hypothetical protein